MDCIDAICDMVCGFAYYGGMKKGWFVYMAKNANIEIDSKLSLAGNIIVTAVSLVSVLPVLFKNMNADGKYTLVCAVLMLCSVLAALTY